MYGTISNVVQHTVSLFFSYVATTGKEEDVSAIQEHMLRHEVYLDRQYRGYYYLSEKIEDDLYGSEQPVSWNELLEDYQLFKDSQGNLSIQPKGWR